MSFRDRIQAVNQYDFSGFRPFRVAGVRVGSVRHAFAATLTRWPDVFAVTTTAINLAPTLDTPPVRTAALQAVLLQLRDEGLIRHWRNELYPVNRYFAEPPYLLLERAAAPWFGLCAYGVHLNGFVRTAQGIEMWLGRRARDKPGEPGKLDQLVAGGQPAGLGLHANLLKECWEEAGIPAALAARAVPVGAVSYCRETPQGLRPDVLFVYDLELPPDFSPVNQDGEVEAFLRWPLARVLTTVRDTDAFKLNCALVVIDFLIRHGSIPPEQPDYLALLHGLRARETALAEARRLYPE